MESGDFLTDLVVVYATAAAVALELSLLSGSTLFLGFLVAHTHVSSG